jgi:hypothetical protein
MAEEKAPGKFRPAAIGIAAAVGLGTFYLMRKRARVCIDLPEIWSPHPPLHLTDEAYERARHYIAKRLHRDYNYPYAPEDKPILDPAQLLSDTANFLQECKWEELESTRAIEVYKGIGSIIKAMQKEIREDPDLFMEKHKL